MVGKKEEESSRQKKVNLLKKTGRRGRQREGTEKIKEKRANQSICC